MRCSGSGPMQSLRSSLIALCWLSSRDNTLHCLRQNGIKQTNCWCLLSWSLQRACHAPWQQGAPRGQADQTAPLQESAKLGKPSLQVETLPLLSKAEGQIKCATRKPTTSHCHHALSWSDWPFRLGSPERFMTGLAQSLPAAARSQVEGSEEAASNAPQPTICSRPI